MICVLVSLWVFRRDPNVSKWLRKQKPSLAKALEASSDVELKQALDLVENSAYYLTEDSSVEQIFGFNSSPFYDPTHRHYFDFRRKRLMKKISETLREREANWWRKNFFNDKTVDVYKLIKNPHVLYVEETYRREIKHWHDGFYGEGFEETIPARRTFHLILDWQGRKFSFDPYATLVLKEFLDKWELDGKPFVKDNMFRDLPESTYSDLYGAILYDKTDSTYTCEHIKNIIYVLVYNNFLAEEIMAREENTKNPKQSA